MISSNVLPLCILASLVFAAGAKPKSEVYAPRIDPANFVAGVTHPYFPLVPGTVYKLIEKSGQHVIENTVTVTSETRAIMGVTCVVVRDQETEKGVLREDTRDWYAQDRDGNVWYFGEDTKEYLKNGKASTAGSWEAGLRGSQPGLVMPAHLAPGDPYRQEYGKGVAEDMGQIVAIGDSVRVPYGEFKGCVRTKEWSLLESGSERKWYAKGVGMIRSESTDHETAELVSVTRK